MSLTGRESEQLTEAILSAFPTDDRLTDLAFRALNIRLNWYIDTHAGLKQQVIDLITWADDQRRLHELAAGAVRQRPDNKLLQAAAADLAAKEEGVVRAGAFGPRGPAAGHRAIPGQDGFAPYCNRNPQWELVQAPGFESSSELVFVPGAFEQGHDYFLKRVKRRLAIDPKSIVEVGWPPSYAGPGSRGELLEILATALGHTPPFGPTDRVAEEIAHTLAGRLLQKNIMLVHDTLSLDFRAGVLTYYTEWLPDILRQTRRFGSSLMCLKCYQAVEWLALPWFRRVTARVTRGFSSADFERGTGESDARQLIKAIVAGQKADVLRVRSLPDLTDITDGDLVELCNKWAVTDPLDQQQLLGRCRAVRTSSDKLRIVDAVLPTLLRRDLAA